MPGGSWRSGESSYTARTDGGSDPDWRRRGKEETSAPGIVEDAGPGADAIPNTGRAADQGAGSRRGDFGCGRDLEQGQARP